MPRLLRILRIVEAGGTSPPASKVRATWSLLVLPMSISADETGSTPAGVSQGPRTGAGVAVGVRIGVAVGTGASVGHGVGAWVGSGAGVSIARAVGEGCLVAVGHTVGICVGRGVGVPFRAVGDPLQLIKSMSKNRVAIA